MKTILSMLSLQVFADGGAAAGIGDGGTAQGQGVTAGAASQQMSGVKGNPLANVVYGKQAQDAAPAAGAQKTTEEAPVDLNAEFEELIKGKYKEQYDSRMQDTIQKRLKGSKETVEKYEKLAPVLDIMGKKYGVDATDIDALAKAIEEDDSYFEQEALEMGVSVERYREIRKMQRENEALRKQVQEQQTQENANRILKGWMDQAGAVQQVYPSFDLKTEMQNPKFVDLLRSNIDVRTAYEVIHKDDIIRSAMQFTAQTVESKIAKGIAAQGARPAENGMSPNSPAVVKSDVSKLTKKDIAEIGRRVARGERISFG